MGTRPGTVGGGPAELPLAHLLHLHDLESLVLGLRSRPHVDSRFVTDRRLLPGPGTWPALIVTNRKRPSASACRIRESGRPDPVRGHRPGPLGDGDTLA